MNSIVTANERLMTIVSTSMKYRVQLILAAIAGSLVFFVAGGFAVVSSAPSAQGLADQLMSSGLPDWLVGLIACAGLICAGTASVFLFSYSAMHIEIDGDRGIVFIREHGKRLLLPSDSFDDCRVRKDLTRDGIVYRVSLVRNNGALVTLLRVENGEEARRDAERIRALLSIPGGRGELAREPGERPGPGRKEIVLPRLVRISRHASKGTEIAVRTPRNILQTASVGFMLVGFAWALFGSLDVSLGVVGVWLARILALVCAFFWLMAFLSALAGSALLTVDEHECIERFSLFGVPMPFGVRRMRLEDVVSVHAGFGVFDTGLFIADRESDRLLSMDEMGIKEIERLRELSRKTIRIDVTAMHYADRMTLERLISDEIEKRRASKA